MTIVLSRQNLERWIGKAINSFHSHDLVGVPKAWNEIYEALSTYISEGVDVDEKLLWMIEATDDPLPDIVYLLQRLQKALVSELVEAEALDDLDRVLTWFNRAIVFITEKYSGETSRERSLSKPFETIFWKARDGMYISTVEGQFVAANEALVGMLGFENLDEMLEIDIQNDFYADREERQVMLDHLERDGFFDHHELVFLTRNGERRTALESCYRVDVGEEKHYIVGIMVDITEEKETSVKTEEYLRSVERTGMETQLELRRKARANDALLEVNDHPVLIVDAKDFRIIQANQAFKKRFRVTRKKNERTSLRDLFSADEWMKVFSQISHIAGRYHFHVFNVEVLDEEGTFPADLGVLIHQEDPGTQYLIQIEEKTELHHQQSLVRETRDNLESLFNGLPIGVIGFRHDGSVAFINQFLHELTGYGSRQLKNVSFLNRLFARDEQRLKFDKYMRQFLRGQHAVNQLVDMRTRSGETNQFRLDTVSYTFEDSSRPGFLALVTDVNDKQVLEKVLAAQEHDPESLGKALTEKESELVEIAGARDWLERKNSFLQDYIKTITARFKVPIHLVLGYASLLRMDLGSAVDEGQQEDVAIIEDHIRFLLAMVEKATELAELESEEVVTAPAEQNVRAMIDNLFERIEPKVLPSEVAFQAERLILSLDLRVHCDPLILEAMLDHIIDNAVRFTRQGKISVTAYEEQRRLWIEVEDSGIGIPRADQTHIFEPFYQHTRDGDDEQHLGLGLTIARKYADLADFTLEVVSKPKVGTKVLIGVGRVHSE